MEGHVIEGFGIVGKDFGEPWSSRTFGVMKKGKEFNIDSEDEEDNKEKEDDGKEKFDDTHGANIVQQTIKKPWPWVLSFD